MSHLNYEISVLNTNYKSNVKMMKLMKMIKITKIIKMIKIINMIKMTKIIKMFKMKLQSDQNGLIKNECLDSNLGFITT